MISPRLLLVAAAIPALTACSSFSGLDASSSFSCKAPEGVSCQSISGVYVNAMANNLPSQRAADGLGADDDEDAPKPRAYAEQNGRAKLSPKEMNSPSSGIPVRQPPLVLRVWMAPYEDEGGDLHDQSFMYTMVHPGKWMIEANQSAIAKKFAPVRDATRASKTGSPEQRGPMMQKGHYDGLVNPNNVQQVPVAPPGMPNQAQAPAQQPVDNMN